MRDCVGQDLWEADSLFYFAIKLGCGPMLFLWASDLALLNYT